MSDFAANFLTTMLALGFVIALAWGLLRLLRSRLQPRAAPGRADDALRFVRALPVGTKERVVIVEHRGERWLLGVTGGGISTIAHWPAVAAADPQKDRPMAAAEGHWEHS